MAKPLIKKFIFCSGLSNVPIEGISDERCIDGDENVYAVNGINFDEIVKCAGFDPSDPEVVIETLTDAWLGFSAGDYCVMTLLQTGYEFVLIDYQKAGEMS